MTESMVERVARALDDQIHALAAENSQFAETHDGRYLGIEGMVDLHLAARAAIAAMRKPTYRVQMAGPPRLLDLTIRDMGDLWRSKIDAALRE